MERTGMQARNQELYKKALSNLKILNQRQADIIKTKDKEIKKLTKENTSLAYELRVITNKYTKLVEEYRKKQGGF